MMLLAFLQVPLLLLAASAESFENRLVAHEYLEMTENMVRVEFPVPTSSRLYNLSRPIIAYDEKFTNMTIFANGSITMGNYSTSFLGQLYESTLNETTQSQCKRIGNIQIREFNVSTVKSGSCVYHHLDRLTKEIRLIFTDDQDFKPKYTILITWINVGCMSNESEPLNTFSLIILVGENTTYAVSQLVHLEGAKKLLNILEELIMEATNNETPRNATNIGTITWKSDFEAGIGGEWIQALRKSTPATNNEIHVGIKSLNDDFLNNTRLVCSSETPIYEAMLAELGRRRRFAEFRQNTEMAVAREESNAERCQQPILEGPCRAKMTRFGFNKTTGRCERFTYGGCRGNENNFNSILECERACHGQAGKITTVESRTSAEGKCQMPLEAGPCRAFVSRFGYNAKTGRCENFVYGGCRGNENNFETTNECERECSRSARPIATLEASFSTVAKCQLPLEAGPCRAYVSRFGYNTKTGRCKNFVYGGCRGNENNFESLEDCERECLRSAPPVSTSEPKLSTTEKCQLPLEVGPCRGRLPRFGYNAKTGRCENFVYGGCRGNENNFESIEECERECSRSARPITTTEAKVPTGDRCQLPLEIGPCRAAMPRFGFSPASGRCESFIYGGCGGNENNFNSIEDCERTCSRSPQPNDVVRINRCQLPVVPGPCLAYFPRFGFNVKTGSCESFVYGGCQGNGNSFESLQECQLACERGEVRPQPRNRCHQPLERGPCRASMNRYGFNATSGRCVGFIYGGCQGNENNFNTMEDCEHNCGIAVQPYRCEGVRCGYNARCEKGQCICEAGFIGDPRSECRRIVADPCASVRCGYNARCVEGRCVCEEGYEGDPERECRRLETVAAADCRTVRCGANARCHEGQCFCEHGYAGDPRRECRRHDVPARNPCENVRCGYNARCENGRCVCESGSVGDPQRECRPIVRAVDPCHNVRCGYNARCENGQCVCETGSFGDPQRECRAAIVRPIDPCHNVRCGYNARCENGQCVCEAGSVGDPERECRPIVRTVDPCHNVRCGYNARCENGQCVCEAGSIGDPERECRPIVRPVDPCHNVRCGYNARCENGQCVCEAGSVGDPERECRPIVRSVDPCENVRCGYNAHCRNGQCLCEEGYAGDPERECRMIVRPVVDPCQNVRCGYNAHCRNGQCFCDEGLFGDPQSECRHYVRPVIDPCRDVRCGYNAKCISGQCFCETGFYGDPNRECRRPEIPVVDLCQRVRCGYNAKCVSGRCVCEEGFFGDPERECRGELRPVVDPCQRVRCGYNAKCDGGRCVCEEGFFGDPERECRGELRPVSDPCQRVRCGYNAKCVGGHCVCEEGFFGDPERECRGELRPAVDLCQRIRCGYNAKCIGGRCVCEDGFFGDPERECRGELRPVVDPCQRVRCGYNARCTGGRCVCEDGFFGDPERECRREMRPVVDLCRDVRCGYNARCREGQCLCEEGFFGDPERECRRQETSVADRCRDVRCGYHARCEDGRCVCKDGFEGDPRVECRRDERPTPVRCGYRLCGYYARCDDGQCVCEPGFAGDPLRECRRYANGGDIDLCRSVHCGRNARCNRGRCYCENGFYGDPASGCQREGVVITDACRNARCGYNARCVDGICACEEGFEGDPQRECRRSRRNAGDFLLTAMALLQK